MEQNEKAINFIVESATVIFSAMIGNAYPDVPQWVSCAIEIWILAFLSFVVNHHQVAFDPIKQLDTTVSWTIVPSLIAIAILIGDTSLVTNTPVQPLFKIMSLTLSSMLVAYMGDIGSK